MTADAGDRRENEVKAPEDVNGNATHWAWRFSSRRTQSLRPLEERFFLQTTTMVARGLLGGVLRSTVGDVEVAGVIVEVEAYLGPHDPASHAATRNGRTARNASMFGPPGHAYVYRSYGVHWCLNVVTEPSGSPSAVLIRALDPLSGMRDMALRRGGRSPLCAGPGRLAQALGITGELDGHPLGAPPVQLLEGWPVPDVAVAVSGRIGVSRAAQWPLRFYLVGHPEVSRGPHSGLVTPYSKSERSFDSDA